MKMLISILKKKHLKLKYRSLLFLISMLLLMISLAIISSITYFSTTNYVMDKMDSSLSSNLLQTSNMLKNNLSQIEGITRSIASDEALKDKIIMYNSTDALNLKLQIQTDINSYLIKMGMFNESISSIVVLTEQIAFYTGNDVFYNISKKDLSNSRFKEKLLYDSTGNPIFFEPVKTDTSSLLTSSIDILNNSYSYRCTVWQDNEDIGTVFVTIKTEIFHDVFKDSQNFIILGSDNNALWKGDDVDFQDIELVRESLNKKNSNENLYKLTNKSFNAYVNNFFTNDWKIISILKVNSISKRLFSVKFLFITSMLISALLAFIFSGMISKKITKPISTLLERIRKYRLNSTGFECDNIFNKPAVHLQDSVLFYLIGVIILPSALYLLLTYTVSFRFIKDYVIELNQRTFIQTLDNTNYYLGFKSKIYSSIIFNKLLQSSLYEQSNTQFPGFAGQTTQNPTTNIHNMVDLNIRLYEGKDEITIYDKDGLVFFENNIYPAAHIKMTPNDIENMKNNNNNIFSWNQTVVDSYKREMVDVWVKINYTKDFTNLGYLHCRFPEFYLESIYRNALKDNTTVFIINEDNIIISHSNKNLINTRFNFTGYKNSDSDFINNKEEFIFKKKLDNCPWYLVAQYKNSIYLNDTKQFVYDRLYILILLVFGTIIIAYMVSGNLTSSINKMKRLLKAMDINNTEAVFSENSSIHEIMELGAGFNEMVLRIENLVDQLLLSVKKQTELETREKEAEMIALQAQINPHFLYNTFESINALIQMDEKHKAVKMVTALSDMLRFVADSGNTVVPISEELLYAKTYFEIMQMRFGDKLSFKINADDSILHCKTIKLILQPVIENAIYHGIVPKTQPGKIHVNCSARDDAIVFLIYDNGKGMSEESLELLNSNLDNKHYKGKIGLYNVQNRLRLFYGEHYGLKIESKIGKGTTVEIKIPKVSDIVP